MCDCQNGPTCQPLVCLPELGNKITVQATAAALNINPQPAVGAVNNLLAYTKLASVHCLKIKCPPVLEITGVGNLLAFLEDTQNQVTGDQKTIQQFLKGNCGTCGLPPSQRCTC